MGGAEPNERELLVVVRALPMGARGLLGRARVEAQRAAARAARDEAARLAGAAGARFSQASDGRPLPEGEWHWSVSHGGDLVAAVVHTAPVGVDVERVADRRPEVVARVVRDDERPHLPPTGGFTRAWTAKEAVLKATQLGLSGLRRCRIVAAAGATRGAWAAERPFDESFDVELDGRRWRVLALELDGHVVAVTTESTSTAVSPSGAPPPAERAEERRP